jgi:hypothetical protein
MKQEEIVKVLQTTAERVQQAKGSEKEVCYCSYSLFVRPLLYNTSCLFSTIRI